MMFGLHFPILESMVIQFVKMVPMAAISPAERLIDEGKLIKHAERTGCPRATEMVAEMSGQKKALAKLALDAVHRYPALMFQAMMEDWSYNKVRFEINKRDGKAGKKDFGK
jgi:hypothetical protein